MFCRAFIFCSCLAVGTFATAPKQASGLNPNSAAVTGLRQLNIDEALDILNIGVATFRDADNQAKIKALSSEIQQTPDPIAKKGLISKRTDLAQSMVHDILRMYGYAGAKDAVGVLGQIGMLLDLKGDGHEEIHSRANFNFLQKVFSTGALPPLPAVANA